MQALQRDGVALAYTEAGSGPQTLLFLHGWTTDHTTFVHQIEHFKHSHRTIAVDLIGHGVSDAPHHHPYNLPAFADDIAWLCSLLKLEKPVVVGHSMGGTIALELAARYPDLVSSIILLDSVIFPPPSLRDEVLLPLENTLQGASYRDAILQGISGLFLPNEEGALKAQLLESSARTPQHVALPTFRNHLTHYDASEAASKCRVPVGYISATNLMADLVKFQSLCPQLVTGQVMLAGHFFLLTAPEQTNAMIEQFLTGASRFANT